MRPAAALVYLASVARVAAIEYVWLPPRQVSVRLYVELHIDHVNPISVGDGILTQFEKKSSWQT